MVKNPPANAGDMDLIPNPGRPHMPWSKQLSLCATVIEPLVLSLKAAAAEVPELQLLKSTRPRACTL